jgi:hypothetical protein
MLVWFVSCRGGLVFNCVWSQQDVNSNARSVNCVEITLEHIVLAILWREVRTQPSSHVWFGP